MREGWFIKKLGEICNFQGGSQPPKSQFISEDREEYVRFLQIRDFKSDKHIVYIPASSKNRLCNETDIMIGRYGASVGQILRGKAGAYNVALIKTIPNEKIIDRNFFFFYLNSSLFQKPLTSVSDRSAQAGFNKEDISSFDIPLPPLPEQKQIVAILDEAFEGIDRAIANAEKNLDNSRELFESYLNAIFTQKGDGWEKKKLGDIATFRNGLNFTKSSKGESIKIVGVKDFQNHFWIQEAELDSVTIDANLKEIDILRKGDILTVRSNGNKELIGRCLLANELSEKTSHSGFTIRIRIEKEDIYPQFIVHYLKSKELRKQLAESGGGISISSLNQQGLSLIIINFPTFLKQKAIVANIDEIAFETQRLEAIYRQKLVALNELKQSILQKAFTGELTANTPKTIKEELAA